MSVPRYLWDRLALEHLGKQTTLAFLLQRVYIEIKF